MSSSPAHPDRDHDRVTTAQLATLAGSTAERIEMLAEHRILVASDDGTFAVGDVHRLRLLEAFEAAGVPLEGLLAGAATGRIDFEGYHELHRDVGLPSPRPYGAFRAAVDPDGSELPALFAAMGVAEPSPASHLTADDEVFIEDWLGLVRGVDDPALAVRVVRLFAEGTRRASEASLDVYAEAASRLAPDPASVDPVDYARLLEPWARLARALPPMAAWLTERHVRQAIDAFSVETTERILASEGFVAGRDAERPGIAFIDLTGYTRATLELGDEAAAKLSVRLGDLARAWAEAHGGRLVKLLGDGALLQLPDGVSAVQATLDLLAALPGAGLPTGHAGVHTGTVIEREGDVYGRTVNLAARISDLAPDGALYISAEVARELSGSGIGITREGSHDLQGIGPVELFRVDTTRR